MCSIALQLYSVRNYTGNDPLALFHKVRQAGFQTVELAGTYGLSSKELKDYLEEAGLRAVSAHVALDKLRDEPETVKEDALTLGLETIVCPYADPETEEEIHQLAAVLNKMQRLMRPAGIRVGYHNHAHEFKKKDGRCILDRICEAFEEDGMFIQLDTCWAAFAGADIVDYLEHLGDKTGPVHLKELAKDYSPDDRSTVDAVLGEGCLDFPAALKVLADNGVLERGLIIEQEGFDGDPFTQLKTMHDYVADIVRDVQKKEK